MLSTIVLIGHLHVDITLLSDYKMVSFQRKGLQFIYVGNLHLIVRKFIVYNLNVACNQGILELKENHAHVIHGPTERSQGVV